MTKQLRRNFRLAKMLRKAVEAQNRAARALLAQPRPDPEAVVRASGFRSLWLKAFERERNQR